MLEAQAQASAGGQVGSTDAQLRAAENLSGSVMDLQEQLQNYETSFGLYSSLAARDVRSALPGGIAGAGRLMGGIEGGKTSVFQEIYRNINGTDHLTAEGVRRVARQLDGAAIGVSRASSDPNVYIRATELSQRVLNAYADELGRAGDTGTNIMGRTRALRELIDSKSFEAALAALGSQDPLIMGSAWQTVQGAQSGAAAYEAAPGAIGDLARGLANVGLASQIAQSRLAQQVTGILGFDEKTVKGLMQSEPLMQGHMSLAVPPKLMDRVLNQLVNAKLFDPSHLDQILKANGFDVSFDMVDGKMLTATVSAGSRTFNSHTVEVSEGISRTYSDSMQFDDRREIHGGLGVMPHLDQLLLKAYEGDIGRGARDTPLYWSLARNVGEFAAAQGIQLSASFGVSHFQGLEEHLSGKAIPEALLSAYLKMKIELPGNVSSNWSQGHSKGADTRLDVNTLAAGAIIEQERRGAVGEYERMNGAGSAAHADQSALSQVIEQRVIGRMDSLVKSARGQADEAAQMNDTVPKLEPPK
jgi:hypothetical protein